MQGYIMGMFAETSIHPGAGQSRGVIDLPVSREESTGYPLIPGSSLKGALRSKAEDEQYPYIDDTFGKHDGAGGIGITDARILLLPVRSLSKHYRWVTCPYILERLQRDYRLAGQTVDLPKMEFEEKEKVEAIVGESDTNFLYLEEFSYQVKQNQQMIQQVAEVLASLIHHDLDPIQQELQKQLVILSNDEFAHFAQYGLPVRARNKLSDETKESENLWYEETIPPDTLMYSVLLPRHGKEEVMSKYIQTLEDRPYLQVGGNETLGQGWFITSLFPREANE